MSRKKLTTTVSTQSADFLENYQLLGCSSKGLLIDKALKLLSIAAEQVLPTRIQPYRLLAAKDRALINKEQLQNVQ